MRAVSTFATALALPMLVPRGATAQERLFDPPDWVTVPSFSIDVWPRPIVLPGPVIVSLVWSAPEDNYAMGPVAGGKPVRFTVELYDSHGELIAKAQKSPEVFYGLAERAWVSPIEPGRSTIRQVCIFWSWVDEDWLAGDGGHHSRQENGHLVLRLTNVPSHVKQQLGNRAAGHFERRVSIPIRTASRQEKLAWVFFREGGGNETSATDWIWIPPTIGRRILALLPNAPPGNLKELVQGLVLMDRLMRVRASVRRRVPVRSELSQVRRDVEEFVRRFPANPISDNLLYNVGETELVVDRKATRSALRSLAEKVSVLCPGGDVAKNAWRLRSHLKAGSWPTTKAAIPPPTQSGKGSP